MSFFRLSNTDFARLEIDLIEFGFVEIPDGVQLGAPNRAGSEVGFVFGGNIQLQLVVFEFKTLHVRIVRYKCVAVGFLRIFFERAAAAGSDVILQKYDGPRPCSDRRPRPLVPE